MGIDFIREAAQKINNDDAREFENMFKNSNPSIIEKWLDLSDAKFYSRLIDHIDIATKFQGVQLENESLATKLIEFKSDLTREQLLEYLETEEGIELLETQCYIPLTRIYTAKALGLIKFSAEGGIIVGAYGARVLGKGVTEIIKALKETAKYAYMDSKNVDKELRKSWHRNNLKGIKDIIGGR